MNKTLFTLFDFNCVRIKCLLMTQNRKLLISSSKMRDYILKKREQSLYLNPKLSHEEAFWFVSKSFCYTICTKFPKKLVVVGGKEKRAFYLNTINELKLKRGKTDQKFARRFVLGRFCLGCLSLGCLSLGCFSLGRFWLFSVPHHQIVFEKLVKIL